MVEADYNIRTMRRREEMRVAELLDSGQIDEYSADEMMRVWDEGCLAWQESQWDARCGR